MVGAACRVRTGWISPAQGLRHPAHLPQRRWPGAEPLPLSAYWDGLVHLRVVREVMAHLVKARAEVCRRVEAAEPGHRPVPPLDAPVVLFYPGVQALAAAVAHPLAWNFPDGAGVAGVPVRGCLLGRAWPHTCRDAR